MNDVYYTLDKIIEEASLSYVKGEKALKKRFNNYRSYGLIGPPEHKEERQGGAGLWHPIQKELFFFYIIQAKKGISTTTLSNYPVGWWLVRLQGISLKQIHQVFKYGIEHSFQKFEKTDNRSLHQENISRNLDKMINKNAKPSSRKDIRAQIEILLLDLYNPPVSRKNFVYTLSPIINAKPGYQEQSSETIYQTISDRLLALKEYKVLSSDKSDEFWLWARDFWMKSMGYYLENIENFRGISDLFFRPTLNEILNNAIVYMLGIFGYGIRALRENRGSILPVTLNPSLKSLFED